MFKYLDYISNVEGSYRYRLTDSLFTTTFTVSKKDRISILKKIIHIYEGRNLNVPDAVARYYYSIKNIHTTASIRMIYEDCYPLGLSYTRTYHICVVNRFHNLDWICRGRYLT